jgi:hypothetical protein
VTDIDQLEAALDAARAHRDAAGGEERKTLAGHVKAGERLLEHHRLLTLADEHHAETAVPLPGEGM